jgi:hypothetical protein
MGVDVVQERAAKNQSRFREVNERMEASNAAHRWFDPPFPDWVCECAQMECAVPVRLTVAEYEKVRSDPAHFLVAPGEEHIVTEVERLVARNERYWVVEKLGHAADVSEELDPRTDE